MTRAEMTSVDGKKLYGTAEHHHLAGSLAKGYGDKVEKQFQKWIDDETSKMIGEKAKL